MEFFQLFARAPKIRHLALPSYISFVGFPWSKLTSLGRIDESWSLSHILSTLGECRNVRRFDIALAGTYPGPLSIMNDLNIRAQSLSFLRSWSTGNATMMSTLLSCLIAPSLVELVIEGTHRGSELEADPTREEWDMTLNSFVSRSRCLLQSLTLEGNSVGTVVGLPDVFALIPTLTYLKLVAPLTHRIMEEGLFRRLTLSSQAVPSSADDTLVPRDVVLLPKLQRVELVFTGKSNKAALNKDVLPSLSQMLDMAESRSVMRLDHGGRVISHRLYSISVSIEIHTLSWILRRTVSNFPSAAEKARIRKLVESGMEVQIEVQ
ncbi:hypothetical protein D9757_005997 [Collybiopsis confluens]|uniref:Uncharacterized protein n=1 Tax=Collybiopsis confluens TaxID=2823264 RepID=A0A8H5HUG9_9AGAR|nr:hypothetical protein D9757_005997 [Collybiopsis confluens]